MSLSLSIKLRMSLHNEARIDGPCLHKEEMNGHCEPKIPHMCRYLYVYIFYLHLTVKESLQFCSFTPIHGTLDSSPIQLPRWTNNRPQLVHDFSQHLVPQNSQRCPCKGEPFEDLILETFPHLHLFGRDEGNYS